MRVAEPTSGPRRIQLSRRRGWRKPPDVVVVSRPSRWSNPFMVGARHRGRVLTRGTATAEFRAALLEGRLPFTMEAIVRDLAGHDLACWCPLDEPCHADVLLEFANPGRR